MLTLKQGMGTERRLCVAYTVCGDAEEGEGEGGWDGYYWWVLCSLFHFRLLRVFLSSSLSPLDSHNIFLSGLCLFSVRGNIEFLRLVAVRIFMLYMNREGYWKRR